MKLKERIKNGGFWMSLLSAVFLILGAFGIEIAGETADAIINGVCSALVVLGIVSNPTKGKWYLDGNGDNADSASDSDVTATEEVAKADTKENNMQ